MGLDTTYIKTTLFTGAHSIACGFSPENGAASLSEGNLYTFTCVNSSYLLQGPKEARCTHGVLDITVLPTCSCKVY